MDLESRRRYIKAVQNGEDTSKTLRRVGIYQRDRRSVKEIVCELFGYELTQPIERKMSLEIARTLTELGWNKTGSGLRIKLYGYVKIYSK